MLHREAHPSRRTARNCDYLSLDTKCAYRGSICALLAVTGQKYRNLDIILLVTVGPLRRGNKSGDLTLA